MTNLKAVKNILERGFNHWPTKKDQPAFIFKDKEFTYAESLQLIENTRAQLKQLDLHEGDRVLILIPIQRELIFLLLALLASKIAPILIDPRLERRLWRQSIIDSKPKCIFSTAKLINWHWLLPWTWPLSFVSISRGALTSLRLQFPHNLDKNISFSTLPETFASDDLIYTLTSGSTGHPKLVSRNFSVLESQQRLSCNHLPSLNNDIHLSLYGIGILQSFIHGSTTVIASDTSASSLCRLIRKHKITRLSIPPGKLFELLVYVREHQFGLPTLECILTGGAPIPLWLRRWLVNDIQPYFPNAITYIVYGSTECEPISKLNLSEFKESGLIGYPVGKIINEISVHKTLKHTVLGQEIFEIFLTGENCAVTNKNEYLKLGDLASFDDQGNVWLLGRSQDLICGIPAAVLEEPIECLPTIKRALAIEDQGTVLIFLQSMPTRNCTDDIPQIHEWIKKINQDHSLVKHYSIYRVPELPVEPRHLWKIQRAEVSSLLSEYTRDKLY